MEKVQKNLEQIKIKEDIKKKLQEKMKKEVSDFKDRIKGMSVDDLVKLIEFDGVEELK